MPTLPITGGCDFCDPRDAAGTVDRGAPWGRTEAGRVLVHPWDRYADPDDFSALAFMLGGSADSWTGDALRLVGKSDPRHLTALRLAMPGHVAAWETWRAMARGDGSGVVLAHFAWHTYQREGL